MSDHDKTTRTTWFDPGLLLTLLLSLFTIVPLLAQPGLPNGSDVLYHVYRVAEMDRTWSHGLLFPSWAEGLYYGYGSPLWHYYASLTYYLTSLLIRLLAIAPLDALRLMIPLSHMMAAAGMYVLLKRLVSPLAGLIAALTYIYSPYLLYTEPYARGTYPELLAFSLFPWILWRFELLLDHGRGRDLLLAALGLTLLIIAHNLMALTLTGLLFVWLLWRAIGLWRSQGRSGLMRALLSLLALVGGVALAAYFWLPVVLESDAVTLRNLTGVALLDYRNFFVTLPDLLAWTERADAGAINGLRNRVNIGLMQWLLALLGLVTTLWLRRLRAAAVFWLLLALVIGFLITPASVFLWDNLRVIAFLQFPWRLLGPLLFVLSLLAGLNALWIARLPLRLRWLPAMLIPALIIGLALPLLYVPEWRHPTVDTSIAAYHASEVAGLQRGTTFTDEYRPRWASDLAGHTDELLADYADGYPVDRLNRAALPASASAELLDMGPQHNLWSVTSDEAFTLEVLTHYWSGWSASIDGQTVPITPSPNHGLITLQVPAGQHEVRVALGQTGPRLAGQVLSLLALVSLLGAAWWRARRNAHKMGDETARDVMPRSELAGLLGAGAVALLLAVALLRPGLAWLASPQGTALPAQTRTAYNFDDAFQVIGYDLNSRQFSPGDELRLNVYWYPLRASDVNFSSFVHVSTGGPPVAQADQLHPGGRAIREWWTPEGYIYDPYRVMLPPNMAPGEYSLFVGLYTCELMPPGECGNGYRPTVTDADGEVLGDTLLLGTITVR